MFTNCALRPSLIHTELTKLLFSVCASFADPENLINGNAMNASSRATALNIVADMLRKLNVSKIIYAQLEPPHPIPGYAGIYVSHIFFLLFLFSLFHNFILIFFWLLVLLSVCSIVSSYVFSGTRPCYVLIVISFVAFVSVQQSPLLRYPRPRASRLVSFVAPLVAAPAAT